MVPRGSSCQPACWAQIACVWAGLKTHGVLHDLLLGEAGGVYQPESGRPGLGQPPLLRLEHLLKAVQRGHHAHICILSGGLVHLLQTRG